MTQVDELARIGRDRLRHLNDTLLEFGRQLGIALRPFYEALQEIASMGGAEGAPAADHPMPAHTYPQDRRRFPVPPRRMR